MISTSYFAKIPDTNSDAISISRYSPKGTKYKQYPLLAPSAELLKGYKKGKVTPTAYYCMYGCYLDTLDPAKVVEDLYTLAEHPILLCYEGSKSVSETVVIRDVSIVLTPFCHRRIVALWLNKKLGLEVNEI